MAPIGNSSRNGAGFPMEDMTRGGHFFGSHFLHIFLYNMEKSSQYSPSMVRKHLNKKPWPL